MNKSFSNGEVFVVQAFLGVNNVKQAKPNPKSPSRGNEAGVWAASSRGPGGPPCTGRTAAGGRSGRPGHRAQRKGDGLGEALGGGGSCLMWRPWGPDQTAKRRGRCAEVKAQGQDAGVGRAVLARGGRE